MNQTQPFPLNYSLTHSLTFTTSQIAPDQSARKPGDGEAILFVLKFTNDIHYKLRCTARLR